MHWRKSSAIFLFLPIVALLLFYSWQMNAVLSQRHPSIFTDWLYFPGRISGTVRLPGGKPAVGYRVSARFARGASRSRGEGSAVTDANGFYEIRGLADKLFGNATYYRISVHNDTKPFLMRSLASVTLTPQRKRVAGVNFVLDAGAQILVRVRDAETSAPVAGLTVTDLPPGGHIRFRAVGVTDSAGEFLYHSPYTRVSLGVSCVKNRRPFIGSAPGYSFGYYNEQLPPGQNVVWNTYSYEYTGGQKQVLLRGTLRKANGAPAPNVMVRLRMTISNPESWRETRTNADGGFAIRMPRVSGWQQKRGCRILLARSGDESVIQPLTAEETWKPVELRLKVGAKEAVAHDRLRCYTSPLEELPL